MKRHFYFCGPPQIAATARSVPLFSPSSKSSRGDINAIFASGSLAAGFEGSYNMNIAIVPSKNFASPLPLFLSLATTTPSFQFSVFLS
jgi:hypothetical protein